MHVKRKIKLNDVNVHDTWSVHQLILKNSLAKGKAKSVGPDEGRPFLQAEPTDYPLAAAQ